MEDERGPGLDFTLCFVCGSRPRGAAAFLLCLVILLLKCLNVRRFPPPSSRIYELRYSMVLSILLNVIIDKNKHIALKAQIEPVICSLI